MFAEKYASAKHNKVNFYISENDTLQIVCPVDCPKGECRLILEFSNTEHTEEEPNKKIYFDEYIQSLLFPCKRVLTEVIESRQTFERQLNLQSIIEGEKQNEKRSEQNMEATLVDVAVEESELRERLAVLATCQPQLTPAQSFGKIVKLIRKQVGLSLDELALITGIPKNVVRDIEAGKAFFDVVLSNLYQLATVSGVDPQFLLWCYLGPILDE